MKVPLELKLTLGGQICYISFFLFFDKDYGSYNYDWQLRKVVSDNQTIDFDKMDVHYKAAIESAIEERLYRFPFEHYKCEP